MDRGSNSSSKVRKDSKGIKVKAEWVRRRGSRWGKGSKARGSVRRWDRLSKADKVRREIPAAACSREAGSPVECSRAGRREMVR
jgi:hypothetical protein